VPSLTTMHGRVDAPHTTCALASRAHSPLVAISESQRRGCAQGRWVATVHHGLAPEEFERGAGGAELAFVGRFSREKRVDRAIRIARAAGLPLSIAAKYVPDEAEWFERTVRPLLDGPGVHLIGEVDQREKVRLLGRARALLFPIEWPEPFGLVMIEALACGTPVIAWPRGAAPEVIEHGVTGFLVESEEEAIAACRHAAELDRETCRRAFLTRFTAARMAAAYVAVYRRLVAHDRVHAHDSGDLRP
jgi:glycosyltransferase involved in cell wall biosynthesis